jgi:general stress protein 26
MSRQTTNTTRQPRPLPASWLGAFRTGYVARMTHAPDTTHTDPDARNDLESLVHEGDVVMLTTLEVGEGESQDRRLTSRPLTVAHVGGATLLFLVDGEAHWVTSLGPADEVNASISTRRNDWVSITGPATMTADDEAIARLWSPAAGAYFDGPTDPRIRVLQLHMEVGEYWSAPGTGPLGRLVAIVSGVIGADGTAGERGSIEPTT